MKIRTRQEDPEGGRRAKMAQNGIRYALVKGSKEGPVDARARIALTIKRFGGYAVKMFKNHWFLIGSGRSPKGSQPTQSGRCKQNV